MRTWRSGGGERSQGGAIAWLTVPTLTLLVVVLAATTYSFRRQTVALQAQIADLRQNPGKNARAETLRLVERVRSLTPLPEGELPTVATVNNPEGLRAQRFFANAKVGYKVLIFTNARQAILYDPVAHKIVETAPVSFEAPPQR